MKHKNSGSRNSVGKHFYKWLSPRTKLYMKKTIINDQSKGLQKPTSRVREDRSGTTHGETEGRGGTEETQHTDVTGNGQGSGLRLLHPGCLTSGVNHVTRVTEGTSERVINCSQMVHGPWSPLFHIVLSLPRGMMFHS